VDNDVHVMHAPIAARLGCALIDTGDAERGYQVIEDALQRETYRAAAHYGIDYLLVAKAQAQLHEGDCRGALKTARAAVAEASSHEEAAYEVCARLAQAEARAAVEGAGSSAALAGYGSTLEQARALGMRPFEAMALEGRAALLARAGDEAGACEATHDAASIWRELGAPARLSQLERAS
jgi:hypothetical protein